MNNRSHNLLGKGIKKIALYICISFTILPLHIQAEFYVYKENDGTSWITDRKMPQEKYTLMATIGRPTAVVSCRNMTASKLEKRANSYKDAIEAYSIAYEVDPKLVKAIIATESCFDKKAVSSVGARGLMQLMPATAKELGVKDSFDSNQNIRGGIKYFSQMLKRFNDSTELALAAYNAGPGAVEKYGGIPPYAETKGYVKKVLKRYANYVAKSSTASN
ncbi:MAG: lytic transglycosylase domain-containing protein [Gammaproteobacteria bacterium]